MLRLIDLSNNNAGPVNFSAIRKAGTFGVWLKVSEGLTFSDPLWHRRADAARMVGLRVGGYHFARPELDDAEAEARYFCSLLGKVHRRDLRPVLDLEVNDRKLPSADLHRWARSFLGHVHKLSGVRALTYTSPGYVEPQGWGKTFGTGAGLWLADWGPNDGKDHGAHIPRPWTRIAAHQYTSRGKVDGVPGEVDLSHAASRRHILAHPIAGLL